MTGHENGLTTFESNTVSPEAVDEVWGIYNSFPDDNIPKSQIYGEYNKAVQGLMNVRTKDGEVDDQDSSKIIPSKWEKGEVDSDFLFNLQVYMPLNGENGSVLNEWRGNGHKVKVIDILEAIDKEKKEGQNVSEDSWLYFIYNFNEKEFEEKLEKNEIFPPMLFFVNAFGKERSWGLLNLGNVLNGNHRILQTAEYLRRHPEKQKDFKMDVLVSKTNIFTYVAILGWHFTKPGREKMKYLYKKYIKKQEGLEAIPKENWIKFSEKIYLLGERLGYFEGKT